MSKQFQPPKKLYPQIYVFEDKHEQGWLKVGYTTQRVAEDRVRQQFNTRLQLDPEPYILHLVEDAIDNKGSAFTDGEVHDVLVSKGVKKRGEFFLTDIDTVRSAILSVKRDELEIENRTETFEMRDEQADAVNLTSEYFTNSFKRYPNNRPQFLWNAKMRFGKTFAAYQLALKMGFKKILVVTYKPAVVVSWRDDLNSHIDFNGWQFISRYDNNLDKLDKDRPFVYFASFQDMTGTDDDGDTKKHNEWVHSEEWDMVIQDEYHYGAWRDTAKELLEAEHTEIVEEEKELNKERISGKCFLYLSGTPFRAIEIGEFSDNQVFNWTYADEQRAKVNYVGDNSPYAALPEMNILTYKLPDKLRRVATRGEFNEFNLGYFFRATGDYEDAKFVNEGAVQKWLDLIEGKSTADKNDEVEDITYELKRVRDENTIQFPFSKNTPLYKSLSHMIWLLPSVSSVYAMANLLKDPYNVFYKDYKIIVAAGDRTGSGAKALEPVREAMDNPLETKTITLSCGKLTTGVTVPPWTGIFMLRALNSPESYFQSAFRVQSPWTIRGEDGSRVVYKEKCFVFDFDPNRALSQIATYVNKLDTRDVSPEVKIDEFIKYLPILAYDGFGMESIDAAGLLDISLGNTTSTLLARGWNNSSIINVDSDTLTKMVENPEAMRIINSIESFRRKKDPKINDTIISRAKSIKSLKTKKDTPEGLNPAEKKQLTDEERKYRNERQVVREKLQTLATRIPLFMYLTDKREEKLTDVIMKLEPELFMSVTGLTIDDFRLLLSLGLFNSELMNNAVYRFRTYEDASMSYSGIDRHYGETIGGFDEVKEANLDGETYIPDDIGLEGSKVVYGNGVFTLYAGSQVITPGVMDLTTTTDDISFNSLEEASDFITGGIYSDERFFKKLNK